VAETRPPTLHVPSSYRDAGGDLHRLIGAAAARGLVGIGVVLAAPALALSVAPGSLRGLVSGLQAVALLAWLTEGIAFTLWTRRVIDNSRTLRRSPSVTCSRWAGAWMLVPVANLWMPYVVAADLFRATHARRTTGVEPTGRASRPDVGRRIPPLVVAWWVVGIGPVLRSCATPLVPMFGFSLLHATSSTLALAALVLEVQVARAVTRAQREQHARDDVPRDEPPPPTRAAA